MPSISSESPVPQSAPYRGAIDSPLLRNAVRAAKTRHSFFARTRQLRHRTALPRAIETIQRLMPVVSTPDFISAISSQRNFHIARDDRDNDRVGIAELSAKGSSYTDHMAFQADSTSRRASRNS